MISILYSSFILFLLTTSPQVLGIAQTPESPKKIKVFFLAGQSNMEGRADATKIDPRDQERLSKAQKNVQLAYNSEPVSPLRAVEPSKEIAEIYKRKLIFGPELFFGITLSEAWPDEKILLIKLAEGGTSLHGCWHPEWSEDKAKVMGEEKESKLYHQLVNHIDQTLSEYRKDEYEICAMLWVQGETDSGNKIAAAAYGQNLQQFITKIRLDTHTATLPFLLFQVGHGKVVEGMRQTAQNLPNVLLLPQSQDPETANYYSTMENGHYNSEGMKKLGERFAEVFIESYQ